MDTILIIAATLPVVFLAHMAYVKDTEREPIGLLIRCFLMGMLIIIPIAILEFVEMEVIEGMGITGSMQSFLMAFLVAGLSEELFKYIGVRYVLRRSTYFNQFYDGIVYAVFVSLGFALVENIGYVLEYGLETAIVRCFISVPAHAFFGVFMGYYLSLAQLGDQAQRRKNLILALVVPTVLHGIFDFILMDLDIKEDISEEVVVVYMILFFGFNFLMWRIGLKNIKKHIAKDNSAIQERIENDLPSEDEWV